MNRTLVSACLAACSITVAGGASAQPNNATMIASGLEGPRGLKFGPDGNLYVAEAGTGGATTTVGTCTQVPSPVGPYHGGKTGRISMIRPDGTRSTVVDQLPSGQSSLPTGDTIGVADVAFLNGELYALVAGGGCSHGNPDVPAGVIRVDRETGTWRQVADLSQFVMTHQVAHPEPDDFEPDETFYSMIAVREKLYVVGPNHGQLIEVERDGDVRQVIDISATQGHIVPTSVVFHGGTFHVGNLNTFPIVPGSSQVLDISRGGEILDSIPGFTTIVGLTYHQRLLYALELSEAAGNPAPGTGKVVRLARSGSVEDVVTGLTLPTGMTVGSDGNLYISNFGAVPGSAGQIIQIALPPLE
jgi:hypothetical protein